MTEKHFSISEIENAFFNYAANAGVMFTKRPLIVDDGLHREHVDGDKLGTKNGAYILHADSPASGWFLHYKTGISGKWTLSCKRETMTKVMREQIEAERQRRQIEQQACYNEAAKKAASIWSKSIPAINHPYSIKKCIQPYGSRLYKDCLVIPLYNKQRQLVNLQFIHADGTKRYLTGGLKKGCFYWFGDKQTDKILICEGFSTGASLHEHSGCLTFIAFDAGNLKDVAITVKSIVQDKEIIICADNDLSGLGQRKAEEATLAINGKYVLPPIPGQDFNDMLTMEGAR